MNINQLTACHIRRIRHSKKLKLEYVAYKIGLSKGSYSKLENGKVEITLSKLRKVASALEVPFNSILPIDFNNDFELSYIQKKLPFDESAYVDSTLTEIINYISIYKTGAQSDFEKGFL